MSLTMEDCIKIAIRFSYDGTHYSGSALQKHNENTVTQQIVKALKQAKIYIENPTFAGRTDKGVSASNMVASLFVKNVKNMNFAAVLQSHLPSSIIMSAYAIVNCDFSARYDCVERHYKYVFKCVYDIAKMQKCCNKILEFDNFKSLCKRSEERCLSHKGIQIDEKYYERKLNSLEIDRIGNFCVMNIKGRSFLHNMVRKIFWLIKNYALDKVDDKFLEDVKCSTKECGTDAPENLIFYAASYEKTIPWIENNRAKQKLQQLFDSKALELELHKIKLDIEDETSVNDYINE